MVSTKSERVSKARELILTLIGSKFTSSYRRPPTLPKGMNYSQSEWRVLLQVLDRLRSNRDIPIHNIFDMEEMEQKYLNDLVLAKFGG